MKDICTYNYLDIIDKDVHIEINVRSLSSKFIKPDSITLTLSYANEDVIATFPKDDSDNFDNRESRINYLEKIMRGEESV